MSKPDGDPYGGSLPSLHKLWEAFYMLKEITESANLALEKFARPMASLSFAWSCARSWAAGTPWVIHHVNTGLEYEIKEYRASDGMFLTDVVDGVVRAIPMKHILSGHYALWGD